MSEREIITVSCGGCGLGIGRRFLSTCATDLGIGMMGDKERQTLHDTAIGITFEETSADKYMSRSIFVDTDMDSINRIASSQKFPHSSLIHRENIICGTSGDMALNFARGHYAEGKALLASIVDALRSTMESCEHAQGVVFNHSLSGGTGAGLGMLILERIAVDYRKRSKLGCSVLFDDQRCASPLEAYNCLLCLHWLLDHTEVDIILDNKQFANIHGRRVQPQQQQAKHRDLNELMGRNISDVTAACRFGINETLSTMAMDFVPFPRLHFVNTAMYPSSGMRVSNGGGGKNTAPASLFAQDIKSHFTECCRSTNFSALIPDFDAEKDKNMAVAFNVRGKEASKYMAQSNAAMQHLNDNSYLRWVQWTAEKPMVNFVEDDNTEQQVSMMMNNTCMSRVFMERICKKYDALYQKRSYVHQYVTVGMEEGEFAEAREDLGFLVKDYADVLQDNQDDDDDGDDDDDSDY